jgi:hypothetical protein
MTNIGSALDEQARKRVQDIEGVDIVVGIPSYNNAKTIGHVVEAAAEGVARHFPSLTALLMNSDGGSTDGTPEAFLKASAPKGIHKLSARYQGIAGKGTALRAVYETCSALGARACVLVDSDLRSITPEWIRLLAGPIIDGEAGYVTPLYLRHKYDGTITNSLAYPFTRALYGRRVRQPIGGDFGVAGVLAKSYLEKNVWRGAAAQFGIDIFMTTTAINEGFELRQANLGAKIHDTKDPAADLGPMFRQVVGTMFALMAHYENGWKGVEGSRPVPTVGPSFEQEPEPVAVTLGALVTKFKEGVSVRKPMWENFLPADTLSEIDKLARLDADSFAFPAPLWVRVVCEFAVACNKPGFMPDEVVDSLTPLYFGRTAGFVRETEQMTSAQTEAVIERLAEQFEKDKPYLVELWDKK